MNNNENKTMKSPTLEDIRSAFIKFFKSKDHLHLKSAPLVPADDPTLLFVNSGMVPFKNIFLGLEKAPASKVVTCQKSMRLSGKHNDLDQIGLTKRHHTLFEMLGNFSFGGYFKKEAISYAWEFITEVLGLDKSRLYVTVHPEDDESYNMWSQFLSPERISKLKENFWYMGNEGPCGPCTEIFYDLGDHLEGAQPGHGEEGDRYLEIWNLVFMTYEQDSSGSMKELPVKCVDTGAGLERLAAVLNGVDDTFSIVDMKQMTDHIEKLTGKSLDVPHKVLADHVRSVAFLFAEGVMPGAEGRAYVLRKLIRRAARFAYKLGNPHLLEELLPIVTEQMSISYPELQNSHEFAAKTLKQENERFVQVLDKGMKRIQTELDKDNSDHISNDTISGAFAFELYDTYGFPLEITTDIARENNKKVDTETFEKLKLEQRERSKQAWGGTGDARANLDVSDLNETVFLGYEHTNGKGKAVGLFNASGEKVEVLKADINNDDIGGFLVMDQTVFYGESGGQMGDAGILSARLFGGTSEVLIDVSDTKILPGRVFVHTIQLKKGEIKVGDILDQQVAVRRRNDLRKHHTATHLLNNALRSVLGTTAIQKGSLVAPDKLRFDFAHHQAMTAEELEKVENIVNEYIDADLSLNVKVQETQKAIDAGAIAFFGEKYPDMARVVCIGDNVSVELCGGTHVDSTGQIRLFKILKESSSSSGVRRIEAVCGRYAYDVMKNDSKMLERVAEKLKVSQDNVLQRIDTLIQDSKKKASVVANVSEQEFKYSNGLKGILIDAPVIPSKDMRGLTNKHVQNYQIMIVLSEEETEESNKDTAGKLNFLIRSSQEAQDSGKSAREYMSRLKEIEAVGGGNAEVAQGSISADKKEMLIETIKKY